MEGINNQVVKLLWTGGWDSTFRLLQLMEKRCFVEPYYVIDTARKSTPIEIKTLTKLRGLIELTIPEASDLIGELNFYSIHEIEENETVRDAFSILKKEAHLGGQYAWLARYSRQQKFTSLELAIHKDDKASAFLSEKVALQETDDLGSYYTLNDDKTLDDDRVSRAVKNLFQYYRFPLLTWSKTEMKQYAGERDWSHIMNATWFCHSPRNDQPCGLCNPCIYAVEEGMGDRLPKAAKLRYNMRYFYNLKRRARLKFREYVGTKNTQG